MLSFLVKYWIDRPTDRKTDSRTPVKQYAPNLSMWGHKKYPSWCWCLEQIAKPHSL